MPISLTRLNTKHEINSAILSLQNDFWADIEKKVGNLEQYSDKLQKHGQVWVCKQDEAIQGMVAFYANDRERKCAFLTAIVVARAARGAHIGSLLMEKCKDICVLEGMEWIRLECAKDNLIAQNIYKAKGFSIERETKDSLFMIAKL